MSRGLFLTGLGTYDGSSGSVEYGRALSAKTNVVQDKLMMSARVIRKIKAFDAVFKIFTSSYDERCRCARV